MKASQLIATLSSTLSKNREKWIECIKLNNLESDVDNIINHLTSIRNLSQTMFSNITDSDETIILSATRKRKNPDYLDNFDEEHSSKKIFTIEDAEKSELSTDSATDIHQTNLELKKLHQPYLMPKKNGLPVTFVAQMRKPKCFDKFNLGDFVKFVTVRKKFIDYFNSVSNANINATSIDFIVDAMNVIVNSKDNWFENKHMIAYLHHRLLNLSKRFRIRRSKIILKIFPGINPTFVNNASSFEAWGQLLVRKCESQWLAGIPNPNPTTIYRWKSFLDYYNGPDYFGSVTIDGVEYIVPANM
jgi:hypothetical protein